MIDSLSRWKSSRSDEIDVKQCVKYWGGGRKEEEGESPFVVTTAMLHRRPIETWAWPGFFFKERNNNCGKKGGKQRPVVKQGKQGQFKR